MKLNQGGGMRYGSDNAEHVTLLRGAPVPKAISTSKKHVVAALGMSLCVGGALIGYNMTSESGSLFQSQGMPMVMNLEVNQATVYDQVLGGARFLLRNPNKDNLCLDDGGGTSAYSTQLTLWTCDYTNSNQVFVYDPTTLRLRNPFKNLCVDDSSFKFMLGSCVTSNHNQDIVYDTTSKMFTNPTQPGICLDDGGGVSKGQSKVTPFKCDVNNKNQKFEMVLVPEPQYEVPAALTLGREFLLQIRGKNSLCLDDGGSTKSGQAKFIAQGCNPSDINQLFVYDAKLFQIRSARKSNLCVDDGGGNGGSQLHLWECDRYNNNQRWVYDESTQMFKNPTKNLCLDDGGGTFPGQSKALLWGCDNNNPNQHYIVKYADDWQAEQQNTMDAIQAGAKFVMRVPGKNNLCVDDGGNGGSPGSTAFQLWTCDFDNMNQIFKYDPSIKRIRSYKKTGLCLDDGGGNSGSTRVTLWTCDANNKNQEFVYDQTSLQLRNPNKNNLCIDDGGANSPGAAKMTLWACDLFNANQHFEYVLVPPPRTYKVPDVLQSGREFLVKIRGKNSLCVDDGGVVKTTPDVKIGAQPCNPSDINQMFVYDTKTYQLRSARKKNLCLDDGGATNAGGANTLLWDCDVDNKNQRWVYSPNTQMFQNPTKDNLCLDDGGGTKTGQTRSTLWTCDNNNPNQHYEIKFVDDWQAEQQRTIDAIQAGAKFIMRVPGKNNLCVDDGGNGGSPGSTAFQLWTCDFDNMNQIFKYDPSIKRIRSYKKTGLCLDDGGGNSGSTRVTLWTCDANNKNQEFVYDQTSLQLRNPNKNNLCIDDGGANSPGAAKMTLWACDLYNPNQHYEYVLVPPYQSYATPPELQTNREFMLQISGKERLCVDDGGANAMAKGDLKFSAQPCNPSNINQMFVYDQTTNQLRSARKPTLCMDDGGASNPAGSNVLLWECDPDNKNQRFVYDPIIHMFKNPTKKNLCLDDGGGTQIGQTRFVLWTCDNNNPNQHFIIKWVDEWQATQQKTIDAVQNGAYFSLTVPKGDRLMCLDDGTWSKSKYLVLFQCGVPTDTPWNSGSRYANGNQVFVWDKDGKRIRSANPSKANLCVDDGGATSAKLFNGDYTMQPCDPNNNNQVFVYDKTTLQLRNPYKKNLCVDDGGMLSLAPFHYWPCDPYNPNQHFEYNLIPTPTPAPIIAPPTAAPTAPPTAAPPVIAWTPTVTQSSNPSESAPTENQQQPYDDMHYQPPANHDQQPIDDIGGPTTGKGDYETVPAEEPVVVEEEKQDDALEQSAESGDATALQEEEQHEDEVVKEAESGDAAAVQEEGHHEAEVAQDAEEGNPAAVEEEEHHQEVVDEDASNASPAVQEEEQKDDEIEKLVESGDPAALADEERHEKVVEEAAAAGDADAIQEEEHHEAEVAQAAEEGNPVAVQEEEQHEQELAVEEPTPEGQGTDNTGEVFMPLDIPEGSELSQDEPNPEPIRTDQPPSGSQSFEDTLYVNPPDQIGADSGDNGDWNLLAPSLDTIGAVNGDGSDTITSDEIYQYLLNIKDKAELDYAVTMYKYARTTKCVTAGLEALAKEQVSAMEYHQLVKWMYAHCAEGGEQVQPAPVDEITSSSSAAVDTTIDRTYMTKLEFYYQIKAHFANSRETQFGQAESSRLRSELATAQKAKLHECIKQASEQFGREQEYEQPEHFHRAIEWVQEDCMA